MNEQELRELIRQSVRRHQAGKMAASHDAGGRPVPVAESAPAAPRSACAAAPVMAAPVAVVRPSAWSQHASHAVYLTLPGSDGPCVIEPSVPCDHCGYCKSHGH